MSKAEEIAEKYDSMTGNNPYRQFRHAINEAFDAAIAECETMGKKYGIRDGMPGKCAEAIRALKSDAGTAKKGKRV